MSKKINYGVSKLGYAPIENNAFGTPVMITGAKAASHSAEESIKKIYGDNEVYAMLRGNQNITGEITVLDIPETYAVLALGKKLTAAGGLANSGIAKEHCLFWLRQVYDDETKETTQELTYVYNAAAMQPEIEDVTDEDEITEVEFAIPFEAKQSEIALDADGNKVGIYTLLKTTENATLFDTFETAVIKPTDTVTP